MYVKYCNYVYGGSVCRDGGVERVGGAARAPRAAAAAAAAPGRAALHQQPGYTALRH